MEDDNGWHIKFLSNKQEEVAELEEEEENKGRPAMQSESVAVWRLNCVSVGGWKQLLVNEAAPGFQ